MSDSARFIVPPELHVAWVHSLRSHFDHFNYEYLSSILKAPVFIIGSSTGKLGEWDGRSRTITISEHHILTHPWEQVADTLRHEMAHQYASEVLRADSPPHGEAWVRACRLLRIEPEVRATVGKLGRIEDSTVDRDKMLNRVKELLALAGSPNEHEAASAMRMAQKFLLKYNLDLRELGPARRYTTRYLGKCQGRFQEYEHRLAMILQEHFFVLVVYTWSYEPLKDQRGRILQISGTPENLDIAEYVYHYVRGLLEPLWSEHRARHGTNSGTRLQYWAGLLLGFKKKLDEQSKELSTEQGLVWLGDKQLKDYYDYINPQVRSGSSTGVSRGEGFSAGVEDGRSITIHRGVTGSSSQRGRLLE